MKETLSGKDKIQQICDAIKNETLGPAHQEAKEIVDNAHLEAKEIIQEAEQNAEKILQGANQEIDQKKKVFESSLALGAKQVVDSLKQMIEQKLLEGTLSDSLSSFPDEKLCAQIVEMVALSLEKEGIDANLSLYVPEVIKPEELLNHIKGKVRSKLSKEAIHPMKASGVALKIENENIILDLSEQAIQELLAQYVRKDFHQWIFKQKG